MKNLLQMEMPAEITPLAPLRSCRDADYSRADGKAGAYCSLNHEAIALAAAKLKCRKRLDLALRYWPEDAHTFSRAMIEVGTAAAIALGDQESTVALLTHLSRRIRIGDCLDF